MNFWTALVIMCALIAFTEIVKSRHRAQAGITVDHKGGEQFIKREDAELKREVEQLRERIKVLERIATEDRETTRLSAEIERLRED
jgi:hypothetical protein